MGIGICVHGAHVMNTISPILTDVTKQEFNILLCGLYWWRGNWDCCGFGPGWICLQTLHSTIFKDEGVVPHVRGDEIFSDQVCNPVKELIVTLRDKAAPLAIKGMAYRKIGVADVAVMREVWGL